MGSSDQYRYLLLFTILVFVSAGCSTSLTLRPIDRPEREATSLIKSGSAEDALREIEMAAQQYEAKKEWEPAQAAYRVATLLAESLGNYQKMISYARKNLEISREHFTQEQGGPPRARQSIQLLARAYLAVNNHEKALPLIQEALPRRVPPARKGAQTYASLHSTLGDIYRMRGDIKTALKHHEEARRVQEHVLEELKAITKRRRADYPVVKDRYLRHLSALVHDHVALGEYENARNHTEKLLQVAKEFGYQDWQGEGQRLLGDISSQRQDRASALSHYQRALSLAEKFPMPRVTLWSHVGSARVYLAEGKTDLAIGHMERAMRIVETMRSFLQSEELRSSFFEDKAQVYFDAVLAQLLGGREDEAFHTTERSRARAFLDLLGTKVGLSRAKELVAEEIELRRRIAELSLLTEDDGEEEDDGPKKQEIEGAQRAYAEFLSRVRKENKEQASLMTVEPLTLKEVQELLDSDQTLLEYFVTPEKTLLWVIDKDRSVFLSLPISQKELVGKVNTLRQALSELKPLEHYQRVSQDLYKLLIEPALSRIRGKELIVVPHDVLHYLPFQALLASDGRYLIEKYPIYYLSSASLLQFTKEKSRAKGDLRTLLPQAGKVLALGNPDLGDPKKSLQYAGIEAQEIKSLYPQSAVYLEKEATEDKAKELSPQNDIIHFASHAELREDDPLASAILLAKSDKEDGRLEVREIFGMDLKASLVVLSACETGLGKLSSGDELVGLTRAFIYAGTPSVVASLWNVEDSSTAHLMASFYKNLKTMTKVESLRQAQLELIRGGKQSDLLARRGVGGIGKLGEVPQAKPQSPGSASVPVSISTSHPYFWAPFILVGDGK